MSDTPHAGPAPVSLVSVAFVLALLAAFFVIADRAYVNRQPPAPQNQALDALPDTLAWKATPEARRAYLADLRGRQAAQAASYAWVDRKAGVVQIPIDQAMDAIVRENGPARTP